MSAYLQTNEHLNVITSYFTSNVRGEGLWAEINGSFDYLTKDTAETIFWVLLNENTRSLQARYTEHPDMWNRAKQYSFTFIPNAKQLYSVGEIAMALDGLEYQSCEASNYNDSEAYKLLCSMRKHLLKQLEDYEMSDTWTIDNIKTQGVRHI